MSLPQAALSLWRSKFARSNELVSTAKPRPENLALPITPLPCR